MVPALNGAPPLLGSHPVYRYLARRYGLNLTRVHWEPARQPSEAAWSEPKTILQRHPARWMVWEAEPIMETVDALAALGIDSLMFDPCANRPQKGHFFSVMQAHIDHLAPIYRQ